MVEKKPDWVPAQILKIPNLTSGFTPIMKLVNFLFPKIKENYKLIISLQHSYPSKNCCISLKKLSQNSSNLEDILLYSFLCDFADKLLLVSVVPNLLV